MIGEREKQITYERLFWLFMAGSLLGVLLEGIFCKVIHGQWETHVVSVWGHFCIIYGFAADGLYVGSVLMKEKKGITKFLTFAIIATVIEYICGIVLKYGLNMKAWDYNGMFMNIDGIICFEMTLVWGILGVLFSRFAVPHLQALFDKMDNKGWRIACVCLSIFMAVNLLTTAAVILRWSHRHEGIEPSNKIEVVIDEAYPDDYMEHRFIEWRFLENKK